MQSYTENGRFAFFIIFIHQSRGRWIQGNENVEGKETYTHNSPAVPTYCIDVAIIIMQKKFRLSDVILTEFYTATIVVSQKVFCVSLTTTMLHNLFLTQ